MRWFYNLRIAAKLLTAFILVAFIAGAVGVLGITRLLSIDKGYTVMYENNTKPLGNLAVIGMQFHRTRVNERNLMIDNTNIQGYINNIEQFNHDINNNLEEYKKALSSKEEEAEVNNVIRLMEELTALRKKAIDLIILGQVEESKKVLLEEVDPVAREIDGEINTLLNLNIDMGSDISVKNTSQANSAVTLLLIIVAGAVALSIALGIFISRIISSPVKKMAQAADKLALGDINVNVEVDTKDEIGSLAESFGRMIENIREQAIAAEKIASGDLTVEVAVRSENDLLGKKLFEMVKKNNEILANISASAVQ